MPNPYVDNKSLTPLTVAECLSQDVVRVVREDSPVPIHYITSNAPVYEALFTMQQESIPAISVLDVSGKFLGVVTHESILSTLLLGEQLAMEKSRTLMHHVREDQQKMGIAHHRLTELIDASSQLLEILGHSSSEFDLIEVSLEALAKLIPARYIAIGVFDGSGEMTLKHFVTTAMSQAEIESIGNKPTGRGLLGVVMKNNSPLRIEDISKDPRHIGFPPNHPPMKSLLAVPISRDGRVYGRIYMSDKTDGTAFTEDDSLLLQNFAQSISLAMNKTRELEEMGTNPETLDYLTYFDSLTGLPNRALLFDRIWRAIFNARRTKKVVVVMFIDLDNFKRVNDALGHVVGDTLLRIAAERISTCVHEADTVARLGGDEFVLLLPDGINAEGSAKVASKILEAMNRPFNINGHEFYVSASIGISTYPLDAMTTEELLKTSDSAMYHAKKLGKNNYQFFGIQAESKLQLGVQLHRALERDELLLRYQPQIDVETLQVVGMEALVLWQRERFGPVSPANFIPLAEETGIINAISTWVLRAACLQGRAWQDAGTPVRIGVSLSGRQFQPQNLEQTVDTILAVLSETGFSRELLDLELTEGVITEHVGEMQGVLTHMRAKGTHVAIDDFSTGYSSQSYLQQLPIDTLKIDKSSVWDLVSNPDTSSIVKAILLMAQEMNLDVIAEGVETQEQMELLRALGCEFMQGLYFSKPLSAEKATMLLQSGTSAF